MFNRDEIAAIGKIATANNLPVAGLLAVVQVESAGKKYAIVDGRQEPVIRFEGHYFDRRLTGNARRIARARGLASPKAGRVGNSRSQQARWDRLLKPAMAIDRVAAMESCSWGVGQVMGAHWAWLGYRSVDEMVERCRDGLEGQVEVMVRFIIKAGLANALRTRNWPRFARGYNGPAYKRNAYDTKMAKAFRRWQRNGVGSSPKDERRDSEVVELQRHLRDLGFYHGKIDGLLGPNTRKGIRQFQKANGLVADGIAGSATWAALRAMKKGGLIPAEVKKPELESDPKPAVPTPVDPAPAKRVPEPPQPDLPKSTEKPASGGFFSALIAVLAKLFGRKV